MNLLTLPENLDDLTQNFSRETFVFDLLTIYGLPRSTITLLKKNPSKLSGKENEVILKNKVLFHTTTLAEDEHVVIDELQKDKNTYKFNPRFIIVTDFETLLAVDTKTKETLDITLENLGKHYAFFLPWAGMEKAQHVNENPADIRAAYKMDKLYQAIVNDNADYYKTNSHDLNVFLSRLLFCFFAEDTGIFPGDGLFTNSISSHTKENGEGLENYFDSLFAVLNTKDTERSEFAHHFTEFPYVNGGLFEKKIKLPIFTSVSRKLIIESGKLGWDAINPDIFGSMIQAVVHPGQRDNLGMHYTSVPNIMKVIEPLFLNELYEELENNKDNFKKLSKLRERISKIKIFDPACGSGNFLIISYKELCRLEIEIIKYQELLGPGAVTYSGVSLNSFYGIEIDDFAHEIARLSLWLTQHQMNQYFNGMFGIMKPTLPLKESGKIEQGNATRIAWDKVCPRENQFKEQYEIYVLGNPPYLGFLQQKSEQKKDMDIVLKSVEGYRKLDYISCWFYKASSYISNPSGDIKVAFVSTNSTSQGEQASIFWPNIFSMNVEIFFAHQSFKWQNSAKNNAGVTCVIIGLRNVSGEPKYLYINGLKRLAKNINAYLADSNNVAVNKRSKPLSDLPIIELGSSAYDGGFLMLTKEEAEDLLKKYPKSKKFIKQFMGSAEFIRNIKRYCIWIKDEDAEEASKILGIKNRLDKVKSFRKKSGRAKTLETAETPYKFTEIRHKESPAIIAPIISSETRPYIPFGFINKGIVVPNSARVIYNPEPYIFSIITSRMHMVWVRAVAGRLKTDIRYSGTICYNTFPFPRITSKQREELSGHVYNVLEEREKYPNKTMAELYDPEKMPDGLREAHKYLDVAVDQIYRNKPFDSDEDRLTHLFKLYEKMIIKEANQ
ncbi:class I SAM-dependent DNA methyltransferase [Candidatus Woesearchaeota archaeon]|jgi:hypothetical protein|nr:class I SAM-dependent DNA methyltransferase [Candidatus Woesearchaeota archaeon]